LVTFPVEGMYCCRVFVYLLSIVIKSKKIENHNILSILLNYIYSSNRVSSAIETKHLELEKVRMSTIETKHLELEKVRMSTIETKHLKLEKVPISSIETKDPDLEKIPISLNSRRHQSPPSKPRTLISRGQKQDTFWPKDRQRVVKIMPKKMTKFPIIWGHRFTVQHLIHRFIVRKR
jgi:hypothetical protein